jgi:hypothetical protein
MDDDGLCALFGEGRGVVDEWAAFAPVDSGDGTLWRGIRAWPWRPGDEGWLLLRHGRGQGLRPVFGVPLPTFIEALDGRPLPDELIASLTVARRAALAASTFIGFVGHLWAGTEPRQNDDDTIFRLAIDSPTSDSTELTELLAGLWPDEAGTLRSVGRNWSCCRKHAQALDHRRYLG